MADHLHNIRDLISSDNTPSFTFSDDLLGHPVFLRLEDSGLMKAYRGSMDRHVTEDDIRIRHSSR